MCLDISTFEDGDEVSTMLEEHCDERKNDTTSWDKAWLDGMLFHPVVDDETCFMGTPAGLVRVQSTQLEKIVPREMYFP